MAARPGDRIGPYDVVSLIGSGGMGEVYRARDTRLNRDVALKVLPELFAADTDRLVRFKREAQVLASLNHPNIAAIHGFEESGGVQALVLELVEGPTLADRIAQGPIPLDEALPIARQIAEALEAAHEHGVVHRDLKPANIKVRPDGTVKVLDFGLAKAMEAVGAPGPHDPAYALSMSPTITSPAATRVGMILGTAAYMSPEQARGKVVDKRSDIWAFGCVLYEMLSGTPAFGGDNLTDTLAAVVRSDADWAALPGATPHAIRRLLRRCLQKDPRQRLADIADARLEIQDTGTESAPAPASSPAWRVGARRAPVPWILAGLFAVAAAVLFVQSQQRAVSAPPPARVEFNLPDGVELYAINAQNAAISPDGTVLGFVGVRGGLRQLYLRKLNEYSAAPVDGTERARMVFFSPDSRAAAFISNEGGLKTVSFADGLVQTVARSANYLAGGTWGDDNRITFSREGALWQVSAGGGDEKQLLQLNREKGELAQVWPRSIDRGRTILFTSVTGSSRNAAHIEGLSVETGRRTIVVDSATYPVYTASGHLLFFRNGALVAAPFDTGRLELAGAAVRVLEDVALDITGVPLITVSASGAAAYAGNEATSRLVWVSREGIEQPVTDMPRRYNTPRLTRDGRRIVVQVSGDLWIQDPVRGTFTRLTSEETVGNSFPVWSPDESRVVFRTLTGMHWMSADGSGRPQAIAGSSSLVDVPSGISADGETLAFIRQLEDAGGGDLYVVALRGDSPPRAVVNTPSYEGGAQFSPDGRWMAYVSDESGQLEIYVRPYPGPDRKFQVSARGGTHPRWNMNGTELFYRNGNQMLAVGVTTTPDLAFSQPKVLFEQRYAFADSLTIANYDVSADGRRFVMVKDDSSSGRINVIFNWFEELRRLAPVN